ncbi:uncharacterized protein PAC_05855 [Phialocephala subalpina]|uniref:Uncharacterized protein n=1 Tax=Phialocephala subalpina TaxID=576137 RepID=A0A1L7WT73_9HELO|nr:uncharacterized protein PAC_05855 [Phialocephala subalpina]
MDVNPGHQIFKSNCGTLTRRKAGTSQSSKQAHIMCGSSGATLSIAMVDIQLKTLTRSDKNACGMMLRLHYSMREKYEKVLGLDYKLFSCIKIAPNDEVKSVFGYSEEEDKYFKNNTTDDETKRKLWLEASGLAIWPFTDKSPSQRRWNKTGPQRGLVGEDGRVEEGV